MASRLDDQVELRPQRHDAVVECGVLGGFLIIVNCQPADLSAVIVRLEQEALLTTFLGRSQL